MSPRISSSQSTPYVISIDEEPRRSPSNTQNYSSSSLDRYRVYQDRNTHNQLTRWRSEPVSEPDLVIPSQFEVAHRPRSRSSSEIVSYHPKKSEKPDQSFSIEPTKCGFEKHIDQYLSVLNYNTVSYQDAQEIQRILQSNFKAFATLKDKDCTKLSLHFEDTGDCTIESTAFLSLEGQRRIWRKVHTTGAKNETSGNDIRDNLAVLSKLISEFYTKTHTKRYDIEIRKEVTTLYKDAKAGLERLRDAHYTSDSAKFSSITTFCKLMDKCFYVQEGPASGIENQQLVIKKPFENFNISLRKMFIDAEIQERDEIAWVKYLSFLLEASYEDLMTDEFQFLTKLTHLHSGLANDPLSLLLACLLCVERSDYKSNPQYLQDLKTHLDNPLTFELDKIRKIVDLRKRIFPEIDQESAEKKLKKTEDGWFKTLTTSVASLVKK